MRPLLRNQNEMRMRHAVSMHEVTNPLQRKGLAHPPTEALGNLHDVRSERIWNVREVVDVLIRDYQTFTGRRRLQGHEGAHAFVAVDKARGRATRDDLTEDASHG